MAKIKLSSIGITNLSGKAGGSVFSRNRGGNYVRNFAVPSNPQSLAQENVRGIFGGLSASWRGLTDEQRKAWRDLTDDYLRTDVFGDQKALSGQQLFISLNQNLTNAGASTITTPLAPQGTLSPLELQGLTMELTAGILTTAETKLVSAPVAGIDAADMQIVIEATPVVSAGRSYVKNRYRVVQVVPTGPPGAPYDFLEGYQAVFGNPAEGGKVFVRAKFTNSNTGETSAYISDSVIVTTL